MRRCPSCGASSFFGIPTKKCCWCGRVVCNKCVPTWHGSLLIKTTRESDVESARYATVGFCSDNCFHQFWEKVLACPAEYIIGTDIENFNQNWTRLWNDSILDTFKGNPSSDKVLIAEVRHAVKIHTERFVAFPWLEPSGNPNWMSTRLVRKAKTALAQNLERCGRPLDSAKIYEELHIYDKARKLREREKRVIVRRTDISLNLNALLNQIREGGIVAVYRCPHCMAPLKISKETKVESLRFCEHCGSEIEAVDVADFLRTALS